MHSPRINEALQLALQVAHQTDCHDVDLDVLNHLDDMTEEQAVTAIDDVMRQLLYR